MEKKLIKQSVIGRSRNMRRRDIRKGNIPFHIGSQGPRGWRHGAVPYTSGGLFEVLRYCFLLYLIGWHRYNIAFGGRARGHVLKI